MSAIVWVNILLTLPFLIAFIGLPLWLTFHRPETAPQHSICLRLRAPARPEPGPACRGLRAAEGRRGI